MYPYIYMHISLQTYVHTHTRTYIYIYTHISRSSCTHTYICIYIYIHIYIYVEMYIRIDRTYFGLFGTPEKEPLAASRSSPEASFRRAERPKLTGWRLRALNNS